MDFTHLNNVRSIVYSIEYLPEFRLVLLLDRKEDDLFAATLYYRYFCNSTY